MISDGCEIEGSIEHSILHPEVVVERGATVKDSILMTGAHVCAGAHVERTVADGWVRIEADAQVGGPGQITVIGEGAVVPVGVKVPAGKNIAPNEVFLPTPKKVSTKSDDTSEDDGASPDHASKSEGSRSEGSKSEGRARR